jgi:hypothetical protein
MNTDMSERQNLTCQVGANQVLPAYRLRLPASTHPPDNTDLIMIDSTVRCNVFHVLTPRHDRPRCHTKVHANDMPR